MPSVHDLLTFEVEILLRELPAHAEDVRAFMCYTGCMKVAALSAVVCIGRFSSARGSASAEVPAPLLSKVHSTSECWELLSLIVGRQALIFPSAFLALCYFQGVPVLGVCPFSRGFQFSESSMIQSSELVIFFVALLLMLKLIFMLLLVLIVLLVPLLVLR